MLTCGCITDFIYTKITNELDLLYKDFIEFTKIKYTEVNLKNFPDVER